VSFTWGELAFGTGTGWGGEQLQIIVPTGVEATGAVGDVEQRSENTIILTGVEGTAVTGAEVVKADAPVPVTGVQGGSALGAEVPQGYAVVEPTGVSGNISSGATWGVDGFGEASFGGNITFRIGQVISADRGSLTAVEATGEVGTAILHTDQVLAQTGVSATADLGASDEEVIAEAVVVEDGVEGTGAVGTVSHVCLANLSVTGTSATADLGASDEEVIAEAVVVEDGVEGTGATGTVISICKAVVLPTGVEGTANLGDETIIAEANVLPTTVVGTGAIGASTIVADANLSLTGVAGTSALGDNADDEATGGAVVVETGLSASARVSGLRVSVIGNTTIVPTGVVGTTGEPKVTLWGGGSDDIPPEYTDAYREGFWSTIAA
jgi:hypothetical protein